VIIIIFWKHNRILIIIIAIVIIAVHYNFFFLIDRVPVVDSIAFWRRSNEGKLSFLCHHNAGRCVEDIHSSLIGDNLEWLRLAECHQRSANNISREREKV
jgi:hypothetical protein